jgi:tRNA threonylcarbamoyladenosine biosynthesis protein TsaB
MESSTQIPDQALVLAFETATAVSSVAVFRGPKLLGMIEFHTDKLHAKLLTVMVDQLLRDLGLKPTDLSAVGLSSGPGSYTGLRVGVSTAKGLCMALDIPLLSMGSLEALAWSVQDLAEELGAWICPMVDARRMEVFCSMFDQHMQVQSQVEAKVVEPGAFEAELALRRILFVGDGAEKCRGLLQHPNAIVLGGRLSTAACMGKGFWGKLQLGQIEDLVAFEPYYLKDFVATLSQKKYL